MSTPRTFAELREYQRTRIEAEDGPLFMGLPDRWYEDLTWRCTNGHVSKRFLLCEEGYRDRCLACGEPVVMTFPEDVEDA